MAEGPAWNLGALHREMWEWCRNPEVIESKRTKPQQEIRAFLSEASHDEVYRLVFPLQWLGTWESAYGAALVLGGKDAGWQSLNRGLLYQLWNMRISLRLYDLNPLPPARKVFPVTPAQASTAIAHAIAVGLDDEVQWLVARMKSGLRDGSFGHGLPQTPLASYALTLHSLMNMEIIEETSLGPYQPVLDAWTKDPVTFMEAVGQACDYHVARFRATGGEEPEFASYPYTVFPAEILATLKVREALEMSAAGPEHALLSSRFSTMPDPMPPVKDAVFGQIARAAREAFPDIEGAAPQAAMEAQA